MKKRNKIKETVIRELMPRRWTSQLLQRCLMVLIHQMRNKRLIWRIMELTMNIAQIWTSIKKMRHLKACWIKIILLMSFRSQTLRSKCRSIMEAAAQKWDKLAITKWPATLTLKRCFKATCSLLTTIWKTETATPSLKDTQTSNVSVPPLENPCTVV